MDQDTLLACTNALFVNMPKANFSEVTLKELGWAVKLGTPFDRLSTPLKTSLMILVHGYHQLLQQIEVAAALSSTTEEGATPPSPPPTEPTPSPGEEPTPAPTKPDPTPEAVPGLIPDEISAPVKGA